MLNCVIEPNHKVNDKFFIKNGFNIYTCDDCGCILAKSDFSHDYYENENYYTLLTDSLSSIDLQWGFRSRYILNILHKLKPQNNSSLLDVGAGNGFFVSLAKNEYHFAATGLEISDREITFAKDIIGVNLLKEDIFQHNELYDFVTCFNVLEHVPDPKAFFTQLVKTTKPGGYLVITTPNPACIHTKVKGIENWHMVMPPHHLNLLTKKSLQLLYTAEGMQEIRYETLSTYINFVRNIDTKNLLLRRCVFSILKFLNLGADHLLILRKPNS